MDQSAGFAALRRPLESAALGLLLFSLLNVLLNWNSLPERIPAHFGITGRPDRWAGRWHLALMLAVMMGLYGLLSMQGESLELLTGQAGAFTHADASLLLVKATMQAIFALSLRASVRVALGRTERLNIFVVLAVAAVGIVPAILIR